MSEPKVTVYITNYNYGRYHRRAIESVLDQTLGSFELVVIDDGSSDESSEVLGDYEARENVFVVFQEQRGLIKSSNLALKMARGDYIVRLDADDYLTPDALETLASVLDQRPEVVMVFPDYYEVDESEQIVSEVRRHDFGREVSLLDQPARLFHLVDPHVVAGERISPLTSRDLEVEPDPIGRHVSNDEDDQMYGCHQIHSMGQYPSI